jgi:hypothetical protein
MTDQTTDTPDPIRDLHQSELEVALRMSLRGRRTQDNELRGTQSLAAASAWCAHRLLERLAEADPAVAAAVAAELADELEMGDYGHEINDAAEKYGLPVDQWITEEHAHRDAARARA